MNSRVIRLLCSAAVLSIAACNSDATGPGDGGNPLPPGLTRWPLPPLSDGPHLSYVVQWFSFALIIVVGSLVLLRQRYARGRPEGYQ